MLHPARSIGIGSVLVVVGVVLIRHWGGLAIQGTGTTEEFARTALEQGNAVRYASLADIVVFVPGYVLVFLGAYGYARRAPGFRRRGAVVGGWMVVAGAVVDQTENVLLQLGLGTVDLDAPDAVLQPAEWLVDAALVAYYVKNFLLLFSAVILLALAMWALVDRAPSN
jgi:hypothetical protein